MKANNNYELPLILVGLGLVYFNRKDLKSAAAMMLFPVINKITSPFGNRVHPFTGNVQFHNGIDIAGKVGDKVKSPGDGIVTSIYKNDIGGNQLIIKHTNGYTTGYAHLNKIYVSIKEKILKGEAIAEIGKTGRVTGPHLHFTLKDSSGHYLDPSKYLV